MKHTHIISAAAGLVLGIGLGAIFSIVALGIGLGITFAVALSQISKKPAR